MKISALTMSVCAAILGIAAAAAQTVTPTAPAVPKLNALATLIPGQWELKPRGGGAVKSVCLSDMTALVQIEHRDVQCSRFVIANTPGRSVVSYSCKKAGHGQTTVKVETPRLAQVDSQGIADNAPFSVEYEARRVGSCPVSTTLNTRS